jgi:hypothetical protein
VEPPKDQKDILDMLVQPQTFGQGLFDYSCHGNNWNVAESVKQQQSPININAMEMTEYEPQFNVEFNYNQVKDSQLENILWTLRVSIK